MWTPTVLPAMINEIEKICPEEGQLNITGIDHDLMNNEHRPSTMTE
jgi:hypothetical protein